MAIVAFPAASAGGASKIKIVKVLTSTQSWTAPLDVSKVSVLLCGGGAGGGGSLGGQGSVDTSVRTVTPGASYTLTIGAGGAGNNQGSNSSFAGFTVYGGTSYGAYVTPKGHSGIGGNDMGSSGGPGASGTTGMLGFGGGGGGGSNNQYAHGSGSNGGGPGGFSTISGGSAVVNSGSGGGGSGSSGGNQGSGGSGIAILEYWTAL
jgi:hypothetical protein